jgi:hypothetical protein
MANRLQHLRGSEAEHSTFTGAKGEISLVTDTSANRIPTGEVRVHDGTTAGGLPLTLGTTSKPLTNNIVLSSGVGINFNNYGSEDSNSATTVESNLLDDYEEGDWTPVVADSGSGGNVGTRTVNYARYTKIGREVTVYGYLSAVNTTGMTSTASFHIRGLPFSASDRGVGSFYTWSVGRDAATVSSCALVFTSYMRFFLFTTNKATSDKSILVSDITSGSSEFIFTVSYYI